MEIRTLRSVGILKEEATVESISYIQNPYMCRLSAELIADNYEDDDAFVLYFIIFTYKTSHNLKFFVVNFPLIIFAIKNL